MASEKAMAKSVMGQPRCWENEAPQDLESSVRGYHVSGFEAQRRARADKGHIGQKSLNVN